MMSEFDKVWNEAEAAGKAAAAKCMPEAMAVAWEHNGCNFVEIVADGACGFAWIVVKPGNSRFAKWLKAKGKASKSWAGGVCVWINDYNQSVAYKAAHAYAAAEVMRAAGFKAYADSRLD